MPLELALCWWGWWVHGAMLPLQKLLSLQWPYFRRLADGGVTLGKQTVLPTLKTSFQSRKLGIISIEAWENGVVRISQGTSRLMNEAFTLATQCEELTQWKRS